MRFRRARFAGEVVLLAAVYFAAARLSLSLPFAQGNVTPVWPPSGIALAVLLLRGPRLWPGIAAGSFAANWLAQVSAGAAAATAVGDTLEGLAAFWLLNRLRFRNTLEHPRDVGALIAAATLASPIAATIGTVVLRSTGAISKLSSGERWFAWWFGDAVGIIVLAPALLTWLIRPPPRHGAAGRAEGVAIWAGLALMTYLVFGRNFPYAYPIFAALAWAGLRFGPRGASAVVLAIATTVAWDTLHGLGLSGTQTMGGSIVHLLGFQALAGATTLMLAAAVAERQAARDSERSYSNFLKVILGAIDPVFVKDRQGRYLFANAAAERVAGRPAAEIVGRTDAEIFPPDVSPGLMAADRAVLQSGEARTVEEKLTLGGEVRRFLTTKAPYRDDRGEVAGVIGMARDVTEARLAEDELKVSRERLRGLSRSLIEAQETERHHIARELHDEIGQALTAVKINLQAVSRRSGGTVADDLDESVEIVERSLGQVRDLSVALRPSLLDDLGLVPALRWYLNQQATRAGFASQFVADADVDASPEVQTACFRIAQEALTNVARHAGARNVRLEVGQGDGELRLTVEDDGKGFDSVTVRERAGADMSLGLVGMHERARLLGGRVTIESSPMKGTVIEVRFPLSGAA